MLRRTQIRGSGGTRRELPLHGNGLRMVSCFIPTLVTSADFSDFNYVRQDGECVAAGPEPVPAGTCNKPGDTYTGSSGYRLIPGNTCDRSKGLKKDEKVQKKCQDARPENGKASSVVVSFCAQWSAYVDE